FEIHLAERLAEIKMLFRLKSIRALFAIPVTLDIAGLVRPIRYVGLGQVGDGSERSLKLGDGPALGSLAGLHRLLERGHLRHQGLGPRLIPGLLRLTDLAREGVAPL